MLLFCLVLFEQKQEEFQADCLIICWNLELLVFSLSVLFSSKRSIFQLRAISTYNLVNVLHRKTEELCTTTMPLALCPLLHLTTRQRHDLFDVRQDMSLKHRHPYSQWHRFVGS